MASSIICGPCGYEDNIKNAKKWCADCEEGYCKDCEKVHRSTKMSINHKLVSIADYLKIKDISVKQNCEDHGKRLNLYCCTHDKALCIACVNRHKSCADVTPLDEAARNAKQSTAFADLQDTINGALENLGECIKDQETTEKHVENQEQMVRRNIKEIRDKINKQLNVLEQKLINDLSMKCAKCKSSLEKALNELNYAQTKLIQLKKETQKMENFASDVQVFLGTREMNTSVANEIRSITRTINAALHFKIEVDMDLNISSLLYRANEMGKILLQEIPAGLQFKDAKVGHAQKQVSVSSERGFRGLDLQIKQKLKIRKTGEKKMNVTGSIILPDGNLLIADFEGSGYLMEYNEKGNPIVDIGVQRSPFDLALIDFDYIAITYGEINQEQFFTTNEEARADCKYVDIRDVRNGLRIRKIRSNNNCWGISHQDGILYVIVKEEGILVADVLGNILNILRLNTYNVSYISTSQDRIYYSDDGKNTVHCCNMKGKEIWVYRHKSIILPAGVSVGDNNELFVAGCASNNITLINRDGTESKTLLTAADGLSEPQAIHYDKIRKTLIVCDKTSSHAALYKVDLNL